MRVIALLVTIALLGCAEATGTGAGTGTGSEAGGKPLLRDDKALGREIPIKADVAPAMTHAQVLQPVAQPAVMQQPFMQQPIAQPIAQNPSAFVGDPRLVQPNVIAPATTATQLPGTVAPGTAVGAVLAVQGDGGSAASGGVEQRPAMMPQTTALPATEQKPLPAPTPAPGTGGQRMLPPGSLRVVMPAGSQPALQVGQQFRVEKAEVSDSEGGHFGGGFGGGFGTAFVLVPVVPVAPVAPVPIVATAPLLAVGGFGGGFGHGFGH